MPSAGLPVGLMNSQKTPPLKGERGTGRGDRSPRVGDAGGCTPSVDLSPTAPSEGPSATQEEVQQRAGVAGEGGFTGEEITLRRQGEVSAQNQRDLPRRKGRLYVRSFSFYEKLPIILSKEWNEWLGLSLTWAGYSLVFPVFRSWCG